MLIILCNFLQSLLITLALKKHKWTLVWSWDFMILIINFFFVKMSTLNHTFLDFVSRFANRRERFVTETSCIYFKAVVLRFGDKDKKNKINIGS